MSIEVFECDVCQMIHQEEPERCERCSSKHFISRRQDARGGLLLPPEEEQARLTALAESEKKQQEWEELLERGQKKMTDPEKLIYAQMQIITELLSEIADGINSSNKIASAPRYGFGVGTFFGGE